MTAIFKEFVGQFPQHKEEAEERAAIMQFDGGMPKSYAEEQAVKLIRKKYDLTIGGNLF
jgi:hypothetical protein